MRNALLEMEILAANKGVAWLASLALFALSVVGWIWCVGFYATEESRIVDALTSQQDDTQTVGSMQDLATDGGRLAAFMQTLGSDRALDEHLEQVFTAARRHGVRLQQGEYRLTPVLMGGFQRYEVQLPVTSSFENIHAFSQQILSDLPFAALEEISYRRETVDRYHVEAKLRLVLLLADSSGSETSSKPSVRTGGQQ